MPRQPTDRRPATTRLTEQAAISELTLTAGAPLAPPPPPRRWRPWYWAAAALLHVLVIAALLYAARRPPPQQEALNNTGVSVVFQPGASTPETPRQAQIPTPAASPPPPPPTPAPNQPQPEVNLNLPEMALAPPPQPTPQPRPQTEARRAPTRAAPARHYMVMNNMSFGAPAPPTQAPSKNLDLSLPESDAQAVNTPELQIQGQVGADWEAGFNKWVYAHLYYPDAAAEQGQQGTVTVEFTAHRDGSVTGLHMTDSSGSPFLDQAWEGIFAQNQLPPFPPGGSDTLHITATVHYYIDH